MAGPRVRHPAIGAVPYVRCNTCIDARSAIELGGSMSAERPSQRRIVTVGGCGCLLAAVGFSINHHWPIVVAFAVVGLALLLSGLFVSGRGPDAGSG